MSWPTIQNFYLALPENK